MKKLRKLRGMPISCVPTAYCFFDLGAEGGQGKLFSVVSFSYVPQTTTAKHNG